MHMNFNAIKIHLYSYRYSVHETVIVIVVENAEKLKVKNLIVNFNSLSKVDSF